MALQARLFRPSVARFDPRSIPNLTGWFDARDTSSYTQSSGQISQWNDKSGSGNHLTQATANNRPTLFESSSDTQNTIRAEINGRQALFFDGVNDRLATSNTVTNGQSRTVFAVARRVDNATIGTVAAFGPTTATATQRWLCRYGNSGDKVIGGDSIATNQLVANVLGWDASHLSCWSQASSTRNLTYLLNNTSYTITGNPPQAQTSFGGLLVGMLQTGASGIQFLNGLLGELVIYNRQLTATEQTAVSRGLAARWGISIA